jgi:serine/threonine protein kinase
MLTAMSSVTTAVKAIKAGAFEFLEKPLDFDRLSSVVAAALPERRSMPPRNPSQLSLGIAGGKKGRRKHESAAGAGKHHIGRYEMLNPIGRGGMGVVYRCTDSHSGETVAVKILQVYAETPEQKEEMSIRFRREAAATKALHHPHIVRIREQGFDEKRGEWYIAMELLEGRGLHVILSSRGGLKTETAIPLGFQVADALAYAHRHKVVHRDIKPSNVHVHPAGDAKLLDFGLAAMEGWEITLTGRVFGSPSYMAPERINGATGGPPADQFSLGVVLYESIAGRNPFDSEIPEAKLRKVLKHQPPPLCEKDPTVPPALSLVIERMMEKRDADRYPSMDEVANEFQRIGMDLGIDLARYENG